jgi:hypothetical protein
MFWLSDAEAIKAVSVDRVVFSKDVEAVSLTACSLVRKAETCTVRAFKYLWIEYRRN